MKNTCTLYLVAALVFSISGPLFSQVPQHPERGALEAMRKRIEAVKAFTTTSESAMNSIASFRSEVDSFKDQRLIKKDTEALEGIKKDVKTIEDSTKLASIFIRPEDLYNKFSKLEATVADREKYLNAEKIVKGHEQNQSYGKKLEAYIDLIQKSKYGLAKALRVTLNNDEKAIADEYLEKHTYLLQEKNVQDSLEQNIKKQELEIEDSLKYPEKSMVTITGDMERLSKNKSAFKALKDELELDQLDVTFDLWKMGMINCQKGARYFVPSNYPDLMLLKNENKLVSALRMKPGSPMTYDIVYSCKRPTKFGGCQDNEQKELCRLAPHCRGELEKMELAYKRNEFFQDVRNTFPVELLLKMQKRYRDKNDPNLISLMASMGRIGSYTLDDFAVLMDPIIKFAADLKEKTPEGFLKKIKFEIEARKKKALEAAAQKRQPDDVSKVIEYLFASMGSELETITEDDALMERSLQGCQNPAENRKIFCESGENWKKSVTSFASTKEVMNLTEDECPKGTFRLPHLPMVQCEGQGEIEQLNHTVRDILQGGSGSSK